MASILAVTIKPRLMDSVKFGGALKEGAQLVEPLAKLLHMHNRAVVLSVLEEVLGPLFFRARAEFWSNEVIDKVSPYTLAANALGVIMSPESRGGALFWANLFYKGAEDDLEKAAATSARADFAIQLNEFKAEVSAGAAVAAEEAKAQLQGAEVMSVSIEELWASVALLKAGQENQGRLIDGLAAGQADLGVQLDGLAAGQARVMAGQTNQGRLIGGLAAAAEKSEENVNNLRGVVEGVTAGVVALNLSQSYRNNKAVAATANSEANAVAAAAAAAALVETSRATYQAQDEKVDGFLAKAGELEVRLGAVLANVVAAGASTEAATAAHQEQLERLIVDVKALTEAAAVQGESQGKFAAELSAYGEALARTRNSAAKLLTAQENKSTALAGRADGADTALALLKKHTAKLAAALQDVRQSVGQRLSGVETALEIHQAKSQAYMNDNAAAEAKREQAMRKAAAESADAALQVWKLGYHCQLDELLEQRGHLASFEARFAAGHLRGDVLRARRDLTLLCLVPHSEATLVAAREKLAAAQQAVFAVLPRSPGGLSLHDVMAAEPPSSTGASALAEPQAVSALEPPAAHTPRTALGSLSPHRVTSRANRTPAENDNQKPWASPQRTTKKRSKSSPAK
jgi:hypothetical protein